MQSSHILHEIFRCWESLKLKCLLYNKRHWFWHLGPFLSLPFSSTALVALSNQHLNPSAFCLHTLGPREQAFQHPCPDLCFLSGDRHQETFWAGHHCWHLSLTLQKCCKLEATCTSPGEDNKSLWCLLIAGPDKCKQKSKPIQAGRLSTVNADRQFCECEVNCIFSLAEKSVTWWDAAVGRGGVLQFYL